MPSAPARAVVEGVGPTKPAPKQQRGQRVKPKPMGDGARRPKNKHPARKGKPQGSGGQGRGGPGGGQRRRSNRSGGQRSGGQG